MSRPLIAILRGIEPHEVLAIGQVLIDAGIDKIEIPLTSPDPISSIGRLSKAFGKVAAIGAGNVVEPKQLGPVHAVGGKMIITPHCNAELIQEALAMGLSILPGCFTPSECYDAFHAGARAVKLYPAQMIGAVGLKAFKHVLPEELEIYADGGVTPENFSDWIEAGAAGFEIGTALFRPGDTAHSVAAKAEKIVAAYDKAAAAEDVVLQQIYLEDWREPEAEIEDIELEAEENAGNQS